MTLDWSTFVNTIDGKPHTTSETRFSVNPATKEPLPPVPVATKGDLDLAVSAARRAFKTWSAASWDERKQALLGFAKAISDNGEELVKLLTTEQGKPLMFARREVMDIEGSIKALCEITLEDEVLKDDDTRKVIKRYTPLGVAGCIVPWNFPVSTMVMKMAPGLLAGNTLVCKPSPFTPYTGLKIGEIAQQFFPPGVLNVLSGDDGLGPWMTSHPGIDKISFTGSTATGRKVMESASKTLKRLTLELGGKDPAIILPDINIQAVAYKIAVYSFFNSGQICIATKRIYVHSSIAEEFVKALVATVEQFKVGNGAEDGVFLGPIQNEMQYERVKGFVKDVEEGQNKHQDGVVQLGGGQVFDPSGYFIKPVIVFKPSDDSRIMREEPFGPVVPVTTFDTEEEVIRRANNSELGLGASVWSNDIEKAERIAKKLEAGSVWINDHMMVDPTVPFGGAKASGLGWENGREGLVGYSNVQVLYVKKQVKSSL
ncbi:Omega-crystallin [Dactylella cylindrospora]|nr:Omega-crystallin [Dactylella cylindrospora]